MKTFITTSMTLLAVTIVACALWNNRLFEAGLMSFERIRWQTLGHGIEGTLTHAHHVKDELLMETVLQSLSQSQGILSAYISDPQNLIVAHTEASEIGKQLEPSAIHKGAVLRFSLKSGNEQWGTLGLVYSSALIKKRITEARQETCIEVCLLLCELLLIGFLVLQLYERNKRAHFLEQSRLTDEIDQWKQKYNAEKHKSLMQEGAILQLLGPGALCDIVLSPQQHVLGISKQLALKLGLSSNEVMHKSWHEIPQLKECGAALENSIKRPGVKVSKQNASCELQFWSEQTPEFGLITLVSLHGLI